MMAASITLLSFLGTGTAGAAEPHIQPTQEMTTTLEPSTPSPESRMFGETDTATPSSAVKNFSATPARAARFIGRVDAHNVHKSGSDVSAHVSWTLISGAPRKMGVRSTLKAKTWWFGYSTKARSKITNVYPGGGRGKAAVARYKCKGNKKTKWYNYGEGFAPGTQKPWGSHKGKTIELSCGA